MTQEEELQIFSLISAAGGAKSTYMEALYKAKEGKYEEADALMKEADGYFIEGHRVHAQMVQLEASGVEMAVRLITVHAEDQMMCAEQTKTLVEELIDLYKKLDN